MEVLSDMTEGLRNFAAQYNYAINDPELIRRYRFFEDGRRDEATRLSVATKKAAKEAANNKAIEVARKMKAKGLAVDMISEVTGILAAEINKL